MANGSFADVSIEPDEIVQTLDLRFLRAMMVIVHDVQGNVRRTRALLDRAVQFAPDMVVACSVGDHENLFVRYTPQGGFEDLNAQLGAGPADDTGQLPAQVPAQAEMQNDFACLGVV